MTKSVLSNWFGLIWAGLISFLLTPLMIHRLGVVYYGMWILAASLLDYYGLIDMAVRVALFRFISRFKGAGERESLNSTLSTALCIAGVIGTCFVILVPIVALLLPKFFAIHGTDRALFQWVCVLVGFSLAINIPSRVLGSYLCGFQRFDLYNLSGIITVSVRAASIAVVLLAGYNILAVSVVTLCASFLSLSLNYILLRRADPEVSFHWRKAGWSRAKELLNYGTYAFFNAGGESLRSYTDAVVIARMLSLALVTPFSIATRLIEYFRSIMSAITGPMLGVMSETDGRQRNDELRRYFLKSTRYMALLSFFLASLIILDGKALIRLWVGNSFESSYTLVVILTIGYVVSFAQYPSQLIAFATAKHKPLALMTLGEGSLNLLLSIVWARKYGLVGVALGTTVPLLLSKILYQPWYALRIAKVSFGEYAKESLARPFVVCGLFWIICQFPLLFDFGSRFLGLLLAVCVQSVIYGLLAYLIGLGGNEKRMLFQHGRRLAAAIQFARAQ